MASDEANIVVFGAGLSGLVVAHRVSQEFGDRVVVIHKHRSSAEQYQGEHLSPSSIRVVRELGYGDLVDYACLLRLLGVQSFWGDKNNFQDYLVSRGSYGVCISQLKIIDVLKKRCLENGVRFCSGRLSSPQRQENSWLIDVQSPKGMHSLKAQFIVDATGRGAHLSRSLNVQRLSDRQVAIGCELGRAQDFIMPRHSVVVTSPMGWWYFSPKSESSSVLILHTDLSGAKKIISMAFFFRTAMQSFEPLGVDLGHSDLATHFFRCASGLDFAPRPFEMHFAAVGDAAFAPDPISSSGIAHSFSSACKVADRFLTDSFTCAESLHEWNIQHEQLVEKHFTNRQYFYRSEFRWPEANFWSRQAKSHFVE